MKKRADLSAQADLLFHPITMERLTMKNKDYWVEKLKLEPHPEGGFYREVYRSNEIISEVSLPERFSGDRVFSTSIYFLLNKKDVSAFHRIRQDEIWHFYDGSSLTIHIITPAGDYSKVKLGLDIEGNESPQAVVKAGCFFAAEVNHKEMFALTGCTVAPGFDFDDFEMPSYDKLVELFPQHEQVLKRFSK